MGKTYDVAIVGTGPAGMFAALELVDHRPGVKIIMFEMGPVRDPGDAENAASGWGGAGAFSDGKLDLTHVVGGTVHEEIGEEAFNHLLPQIDDRYVLFGGDNDRYIDASRDPERWKRVLEIKAQALGAELDLRPFPIRHLGTDTAYTIVMNIKRYLEARGVEIHTGCKVDRIDPLDDGEFDLAILPRVTIDEGLQALGMASSGFMRGSDDRKFRAQHVLVAPGRSGAEWFAEQAKRLGLKLMNNGVDVGVRVEVKNETLQEIADLLYESKIVYYSKWSDDKLRTFCMCPSGYVTIENYRGLRTVNGHSFAGRQSPNTNFAILATQMFTEPFNNPLGYGKKISGLGNDLAGDEVLVQRFGDLCAGRRSKIEKLPQWIVQPTLCPPHAIPGDLGLAIPYRHLRNIIEMLEALDAIAPGIASQHTLLYGVEVKFYSFKVETTEGFETKIPGLYVAGDGSGYTRGLIQSSMQGMIVGRRIAGILDIPDSVPKLSDEEAEHEAGLEKRFEELTDPHASAEDLDEETTKELLEQGVSSDSRHPIVRPRWHSGKGPRKPGPRFKK